MKNGSTQQPYSETELAEFKELIEGKLKIAYEQLQEFKEQLQGRSSEEVKDSVEEVVDNLEREYLTRMANRQTEYIRNLKNALLRIENKTFGWCLVSGKPIPKHRLKAVPHATMTYEAKIQTQGVAS